MCNERAISISPVWVGRLENKHADFLSRCNDSDDWRVAPLVFKALDNKWGPHSVDRFATDYNTHCARFNSRWWCKGTEQVDSFKCNWTGENNWLVPPPRLICSTLSKMKSDSASGTIVVPKWTSAPFWPLLIALSDSSSYVDLGYSCVLSGRGKNGIFGRTLKFPMLAFRLNFD